MVGVGGKSSGKMLAQGCSARQGQSRVLEARARSSVARRWMTHSTRNQAFESPTRPRAHRVGGGRTRARRCARPARIAAGAHARAVTIASIGLPRWPARASRGRVACAHRLERALELREPRQAEPRTSAGPAWRRSSAPGKRAPRVDSNGRANVSGLVSRGLRRAQRGRAFRITFTLRPDLRGCRSLSSKPW
jgi:hypothetical protein